MTAKYTVVFCVATTVVEPVNGEILGSIIPLFLKSFGCILGP